jgi:hypothetical protein
MIQFGPDGRLYLGLGDGGGANDRFGNGQNRDTLLGGLVAIDVDDATSELFSFGLRNPWRFWIEDDLIYVADVGQNAFEEVSKSDGSPVEPRPERPAVEPRPDRPAAEPRPDRPSAPPKAAPKATPKASPKAAPKSGPKAAPRPERPAAEPKPRPQREPAQPSGGGSPRSEREPKGKSEGKGKQKP